MEYVALRWLGQPPPKIAAALAKGVFGANLALRVAGDGWAVFASPDLPCAVISGGRGVVLGRLFHKASSATPVAQVDELFVQGPDAAPERLGRCYWGRYIAILRRPSTRTLEVCRDPSGGLGCFYTTHQGLDVICSGVGLALDLGFVERRLDWGYVAHHIAYGGMRIARTGIVGVEEVLPGQVLAIGSDGTRTRSFWRPADYVSSSLQIEDPAEARNLLFDAIETSVCALASDQGAIILELSGGLDSSIIAMALRGRPGVTAINCTTSGPEGDERRYARLVAAAAGLPLRERVLEPTAIDFRRRPIAGLARPGRTTVLQSVDAAFAREGADLGVSAFFNGTGGDSVFNYTTSTAPAADRLLRHGLGPGFARTVLDIAALTGSTGWKVARLALRIATRQRSPTPVRAQLAHLTLDYRPAGHGSRPWLEGLERALPGRRRHVEAIAGLHGHVDGHDRNGLAPVIAPHAAQPVLEAVLRIPTWLWVAEGRDRTVARQAYADLLPKEVFNRRSKGRINRFIVEAYNANREVIEDVLETGVLKRHDVIDMDAVRRTMSAPVSLDDAAFMSVIRLVDVELWAQGWLDPGVEPAT